MELDVEPPLPLAVAVYVVVAWGEIGVEPVGPKLPIPLSIVTAVALVVVQVKVAISPSVSSEFEVLKTSVGFATVFELLLLLLLL